MFQDTYTHTEKYCFLDRADRRSSMHTRRRRTPQWEVCSSHDNTTSETNVPVGEGFGYPHRSSPHPEFAADVPHMEEEEVNNNKFIGNYRET